MKRAAGIIMTGLFIVGITLMGCPDSFAGSGSPETPGGEPPYGVAVQSDAQGIKLSGVISIEYYDFIDIGTDVLAKARIVSRLRKGTQIKTISGEASDLSMINPLSNQQMIESVMKNKVLDAFFGGDYTLNVTLKAFDRFGEADFGDTSTTVVADIVLVVK